jgi:hypothetical protein
MRVEKQSALQAFLNLDEIRMPPAVRATARIKIRMIRSLTMPKDMNLTDFIHRLLASLQK